MPTLAPLKGEVIIDWGEVVEAEAAVKSLGKTMTTELAGSRTKAALGEASTAVGGLGSAFSNVGSRIRTAMAGVGDAVGGAMTAVRNGVASVASGVSAATKRLEAFHNTAQTVSLVFLGVGAGLGFAAFKAISLASDMEQTRIAFTTMLGSAQASDAFIRQLLDFAAHTPFEFQNLKETAQQFLAFGFNAKQVIPIMTAVGDAVAGLGGGQEKINRVTLALGQMQAKGKVSAQEMMQLGEAGIPAWQFLAKAIGTDIPTAMKRAELGQISATVGINAVVTGMTAKFGGLMKAQSTTVAGIWSNVMDNLSMTFEVVGERLVKAFDLKNKLQGTMEFLGDLRTAVTTGDWGALDRELGPGRMEAIISAWQRMSEAVGRLASAVAQAGGAFVEHFRPFNEWAARILGSNLDVVLVALAAVIGTVLVASFVALGIAIWTAMLPILPFIAIVTGLAVAAYLIYKNWGTISGFFTNLWNQVSAAFVGAWTSIVGALTSAWNVIYARALSIWNGVAAVFGAIFTQVGYQVQVAVLVFQTIANVVQMVVNVITTILLVAFAVWLGMWIAIGRALWVAFGPPLLLLVSLVQGAMQAIYNAFQVVWQAIYTNVLLPNWNLIMAGWRLVSSVLNAVWAALAGAATFWWNLLSATVTFVVRSDQAVVVGIWNGISGFLGGAWAGIARTAGYWWSTISSTITGWAGQLRDSLGGIWGQITAAAANAGNSLWNAIKSGLNQAIHVADTFIDNTNSAFGFLGFKVARIPALARGGMVANEPTFLVGEGRSKEYVIPTDSQYRSNAMNLWVSAGKDIGMFATGGVIGGLTAPISAALSGAIGGTSGWVRTLVENMGRLLVEKLGDWVSSHLASLSAAGGGGGGSLDQWIAAGMALAGVPSSWAGPLRTLIMRESGGNPNAINNWDINAQRGDPSRGLMQTIGSTFNAYRLPSLSSNIFDPIANIVAGIRYILARYGTIFNVQQAVGATPQGYAAGGILGKLRLFDQGGSWLSGTLGFNGSGRTEAVFSGSQMDEMVDHLRAIRNGGRGTVEQHFHGGQVDAQEMFRRADWFARTGSF